MILKSRNYLSETVRTFSLQVLCSVSPDFNPVGNSWARLDKRLLATDPGTLETEKAFKKRVENAVAWLNGSKAESQGFYNSISSMPKRLAGAKQLKGARTSY